MHETTISLSVLEYEHDLARYTENIRQMLKGGIVCIHVDVMRKPFIPSREAFTEETISNLYMKFREDVRFDFHLMCSEPRPLIESIDRIVKNYDDKEETRIAVHREAYRPAVSQYCSKEIDLLAINTGDPAVDARLRYENNISGEQVYESLRLIRSRGFKGTLALEPGTSLDNMTKDIASVASTILLMSVSSGAGNQAYKSEVTEKIKEAYRRYPRMTIQVDGGLNDDTVPTAISAGAHDLVIGSYLTKAANPIRMLDWLKQYMKH
jgi:pentose-5-phosphate-3-epimerase